MKPRYNLRKVPRYLGYDLHRLPVDSLTLRDLEFDLQKLVKRDNPVVLDVGANKGQTIDLLHRAFIKPTIFPFEPNPDPWQELTVKYAPYGVTIECLAFGNSHGHVTFNVSENGELSSILAVNRGKENPFRETPIRDRISVIVTKIDEWIKQKELKHIDFLKVDTQGFDLEVLRGASETLNVQAVETLMVEVNFIEFYEGQCSFGDVERFMKEMGYGLLALYEIARIKSCISWATACFRRS